jgi:hypothetical protein
MKSTVHDASLQHKHRETPPLGTHSAAQPVGSCSIQQWADGQNWSMEFDRSALELAGASAEALPFYCGACGRAYSRRDIALAWFGWVCASCLEEILRSGA